MDVEVCYATRDQACRAFVTLAPDATVADAIARAQLAMQLPPDPGESGLAVFGRRVTMDTVLVDGDRVELLRPLVVDPKEARRRRAEKKRAARDGPVTCSTARPGPAAC